VGSRWEGTRVLVNLIDRLLDANEGVHMQHSHADLVALLDARRSARG
jgi:hypothetical protein